MSLVIKKVTYSITVRFPVFGVDVSKEISESELRQFHGELKRIESAVGEQLGTFASLMAPQPSRSASTENMEKILLYAKGKELFKSTDIESDLQFSNSVAYSALCRLVAENKLVRMRLPNRAWGYTLPKQPAATVPSIDTAESGRAKMISSDLKRFNSEELSARRDQ